jgi:hypothetical protein
MWDLFIKVLVPNNLNPRDISPFVELVKEFEE